MQRRKEAIQKKGIPRFKISLLRFFRGGGSLAPR
jgi:hypothetical protein